MTTDFAEMPSPLVDGSVLHTMWFEMGPPLGMFLATAFGVLAMYMTVRLATIALRAFSRGSLLRHQMPVFALMHGASLVAMAAAGVAIGVVVPALWTRYLDTALIAEQDPVTAFAAVLDPLTAFAAVLNRVTAVAAVLAGACVGARLSISHAVRAPLP